MNHHFVNPGVKRQTPWLLHSYGKQRGASDISGREWGWVGVVSGQEGNPQRVGSMFLIFVLLLGEILLLSPSLLLFLIFWLCWVFIAEWAFLSLRRAGATLCCSGWAYHCCGFSCGAQVPRAWASVVEALGLWSAGWVVVVPVLSCSVISGIYPDQRSYWCPLHCKVDS